MTFFDKILVSLFFSVSPLFRRMNVNISQLKEILTAKLTMDNRRPPAIGQMQRSQEKKELKNATLGTMLSSLAVGIILLVGFAVSTDMTTRLTAYFSMFIFFLAATLISDFTSVLIDIKDNMIILPKPVNDATFVASRLLHITIHITKILLPMLLPAVVFFLFKNEFTVVLPFILMAFLTTLLVIFVINALYIFILRITTPEKFKSIISYLQIAFAIIIFGSYQLIPRMIERSEISSLHISGLKYISLFPPFWFADSCQAFRDSNFGNTQILSLALSVAIPLLSVMLVVKYLAPSFTRKLSLINSSAAETRNADRGKTHSDYRKSTWIEYLAKYISSGERELTGLLFTWKMIGRSREFKMKVYPSFGYVLVISLLMVLNGKSDSLSEITEFSYKGKIVLILLMYFSSMISITALAQISYSDHFRASWIFTVSPVESPGPLITGALKAVILGFIVTIFVLFALVGIPLIGSRIIPHLVFGFVNAVVICSLLAFFVLKKLPFSNPPVPSGGMTFINSMLTLILTFVFGLIHLRFFDSLPALIVMSLISIVLTWFSFSSIRKTSWRTIQHPTDKN